MAPITTKTVRPYAIFGGLSLAVILPMLWPGYILTLDMTFTPNLHMPEQMSSSYLFHAGLHYLNVLIPADVLQKIMLLAILMLCGLGMYFLMRYIQTSKSDSGESALWGAYIAGTFYMINPFVYSRFMAGQYAVLLGYALLPFFARAMLRFFAVPTLQRVFIASGWLTLIGIVSIHTLGLAAVLILAALGVQAWRCRKNCDVTLAIITYGVIGLAMFVLASGYWLFPLLSGASNQGQAVTQFSTSDQQAFQTAGGDLAGKLGNVLQLQGFWGEGQGLYLLPQEQLPGWGFVVLGFWFLIGVGAVWLWRNHRATTVICAGAGIVAIVVAIVGAGNLPLLAGLREPHKFIGLLALFYSLAAGFGAATILAWAKNKRNHVTFIIGATIILLLPVLYTPTMFWGFSGQLSPRQYPTDWYAINDRLNRDNDDFRVLSLPWHLYMHYAFAGRVIVNPSDKFFDKSTIVSNELEFRGASPTFPNADKKLLTSEILPKAAANQQFGKELNELDIKYVLLAKTYDYKDYAYLNSHSELQLVAETKNLRLYRNLAYEE